MIWIRSACPIGTGGVNLIPMKHKVTLTTYGGEVVKVLKGIDEVYLNESGLSLTREGELIKLEPTDYGRVVLEKDL